MEIIYRAFDGEEFDSQEGCLEHEKKNATFRMYNDRGERVYSTEGIILVNLCRPNGGADFSRHCVMEDSLSDGINKNSEPGWYWWDGYGFVPADTKMLTALYNAGYFSDET